MRIANPQHCRSTEDLLVKLKFILLYMKQSSISIKIKMETSPCDSSG